MNLCLACRDIHPDAVGGLARATRDLARGLARERHTVHLLTDLPPVPAIELEGVSLCRLLVPAGSGPLAGAAPETATHNLMHAAAVYREVRRIHEHEGPVDAVLVPLWRSEGAVCVLDREFPTIVSCMTSLRTLTEVDPAYGELPDIGQRLALEREALARARFLHGLTEAALTKTISDYGLEPTETAVIGRGLDDRRRVAPSKEHPGGPTEILFVGRIERRKGVDTLLTAARELVGDGLEVAFTIAGPEVDPSLREALQRDTTAPAFLRDRIRFTGTVPDAELDRLFARADIVCVPSRYESHGVVLIEAMMFGKAIVTCGTGGIAEVVRDGRDALVAPPDDAGAVATRLRRLVAESELRDGLGHAARQSYERRFETGAVTRQMSSFIEGVASVASAFPSAPDGVEAELAQLVTGVLSLRPQAASGVAAELLDPLGNGPLREIRAAAQAARPARPVVAEADPRVTAVVLTRDRPEMLERALDSLELNIGLPATIVIDNGSSPYGVRAVAAVCADRGGLELRRSDLDLGCAGGRRLGAGLAESEFVLFLDDDAELMPGALDHLVCDLDAHPAVGAVAATVVGPDGIVLHSGGSLELGEGLATFGLIGKGTMLTRDSLAPSGSADWVPGTAVLIRRSLLAEFELDDRMSTYYEDNEWCLRVAQAREGAFRRCREAVAVHHLRERKLGGATLEDRALTVRLLVSHARFYERHDLLLGPCLFDVVPELRADDGTWDLAAIRLLLELVSSKGPDWVLAAWVAGGLSPLVGASRRERQLEAEVARLREAVTEQEAALVFLHERHQTLDRVEHGGWWRLRGRLLPLLRLASWARGLRTGAKQAARGNRAAASRPAAAPASSARQAHEG